MGALTYLFYHKDPLRQAPLVEQHDDAEAAFAVSLDRL